MLFIIYINDITNSILKSVLRRYADDCTCLMAANNRDQAIMIANNELIRIASWFQANKMSLNTSKTKRIIFKQSTIAKSTNNRNNSNELNIEGDTTDIVTRVKLLGVEFDNKLTWKACTTDISSEMSVAIVVLHKARHILSYKRIVRLYNARFLPFRLEDLAELVEYPT